MAKIQIYQSQLGAKTAKVPEIGAALSLPFGLATERGAAFSQLGQAIKDSRDKRQETQDQNDARKIIREIDIDLGTKFNDFSLSSNIDDASKFYESTDLKNYRTLFKTNKANKRVREIVGNHLFKEQTAFGQKLIGKISLNHLAETKSGHDEDLNKIIFKMASNDSITGAMGYKEFKVWFNNPSNAEKYTAADFDKLRKDTLADARKLQLQFQIRNDPMSVINNIDNLKKEFGREEGELILKDAADTFVSKQISKDLDEVRAEKASSSEKIANFSDVVKRLNNKNDPEYLEKIPTLDDINDLFKLDQINSSQYAALIDFYDNPDKVSEDRIVDMINAQLAVAKSVEDIDALERQINFDAEFVTRLNITDFSAFKEVFEKYKVDQPGMLDLQHYLKKLDTNLGKIENSNVYTLGSSKTDETGMQLTRIDGLRMYNDLIRKNVAPEDAYVQTLKAFKNAITLPTIYQVVQPLSIKILQKPESKVDDPVKFFEDKRLEVLKMYKSGTVDIDTFQSDLSAIDVIEDMFKVRQSIGGPEFGFADTGSEIPTADIEK